MNYLCKPLPTAADLATLRAEEKELRKVIEDYLAGRETKENFLRAKRRVNDLLLLATAAAARLARNRLRLVRNEPDR